MIPAELTSRQIKLPEKNGCRIVVITGNALRHDRFALRIQKEFGDRVVGWFQVVRQSGGSTSPGQSDQRLIEKVRRMPVYLSRTFWVKYFPIKFQSEKRQEKAASQSEVEEELFGSEVGLLRATAHLMPQAVRNPNAPEVLREIKSLDPYLILTLGGAVYRKDLLECARGLALNQHDGWCPEYKGAETVDWALYHRDIPRMGNTVHILTSGMDAGPIVRRSTACVVDDDTRRSCFARVVALGTELMCEVVAEIIHSDTLTVYDQPEGQGFTYLVAHRKEEIIRSVDQDLEAGFLSTELSRLREF